MRIKLRIHLLSTLAWTGLIIIAAIGINNSLGDGQTIKEIDNERIPKQEALLVAQRGISDEQRRNYESVSMTHLPLAEHMEWLRRVLAAKKKADADLQKAIDTYDKHPRAPEADKIFTQFKEVYARWKPIVVIGATQALEQGVARGTQESLDAAIETVRQSAISARNDTNAITDMLAELVEINAKYMREGAAESERTSHNAMIMQIAVSVGLILAAIFLGITTLKAVVALTEKVRDAVRRIESDNDLKLRVDYAARDEIGEMVLAFNSMMDRLQASFKDILASVRQVNTEVDVFSKAAEAVASGSQTQSASTSSMAASVEEMTVSISSVSNNATDAQKVAQEAGEVSRQGSTILKKTTNEMSSMVEVVAQTSQVIKALGEESRQISSVVQVIKDVADQTNLLALNAAIEAARAGDQGRGFAVVADEVRKLAERTAKSIDDITMMISKIQASANEAVEEMDKVVRQVEQGQKLTQEAGDKMQTINDQSSKVSEVIDEISNALKEQSLASQDIARNVEAIAQMTDKNSDSASNAAKGAKRLSELSGEVQNTLSQFKV